MSTSFSSFNFQLQCHQLSKAFPEATLVTFHVFASYLLHRTYQYLKFTYGLQYKFTVNFLPMGYTGKSSLHILG